MKLKTSLVFATSFLSLALAIIPELSAIAQGYQSAEPKLDSPPQTQESAAKKASGTLQGSVMHVDKHKKQQGRLIFGAKKGHSEPLRAKVKDQGPMQAQAQSSIGIIGVKFIATYGRPPVINEVFPNTPADRVGLRVQDVIVAVDGVPTSGLTKDEVFDLIVGTPGTQVSLSILRNGDYSAVSCTRMDINELIDPRIRRDYMIHM